MSLAAQPTARAIAQPTQTDKGWLAANWRLLAGLPVAGHHSADRAGSDAMLTAIEIVRPAFDASYATLNDERKARSNIGRSSRWAWHGWRGN